MRSLGAGGFAKPLRGHPEVPLGADAVPRWPPSPERAQDALTRAAVTRLEVPPFGPPFLHSLDPALQLAEERDHYIAHPAEYERFVALFGDVHELR